MLLRTSNHTKWSILSPQKSLLDDHSSVVIHIDLFSFLVVDLIKNVIVEGMRLIIEVLEVVEVRKLSVFWCLFNLPFII